MIGSEMLQHSDRAACPGGRASMTGQSWNADVLERPAINLLGSKDAQVALEKQRSDAELGDAS